jgi:hypothetical protein
MRVLILLLAARAQAAPMFDAEAWNRVHAALFARQTDVGHPSCGEACGRKSPEDVLGAATVGRKTMLGGDEPQIFISEDVYFLEEPARNAEVLAAIEAARQVPVGSRALQAALLQSDCWERFDAIVEWLARGFPKDRAALERLLAPLAGLIRHLAVPRSTLSALRANLPELERAFPSLLGGLSALRGWREIRTEFTEPPDESVWRSTTRHAERWGYRFVFRVFVRTTATIVEPGQALPPGSTMVLVGAPLAIASDGEIVVLPVTTLVEMRRAAAPDFRAPSIADLPFDVFEATRANLRASPRVAGGFVHLSRDALLPMGASCLPNRSVRTPLAAVCIACHRQSGERLTGPLTHGDFRIFLETDRDRAARAVIATKLDTASWRRLGVGTGSW